MQRRWHYFFIVLGCIAIIIFGVFLLTRHPVEAPENNITVVPVAITEVSGIVLSRALGAQYLFIQDGEREWKVVMHPSRAEVVEWWGPQDQLMSLADVVPDAEIIATGKAEGNILFVAERVRIIKTPNIVVLTPAAQEVVASTFQILGLSRTFENNVQYHINAEDGAVLAQGFMTATGPDAGRFAFFDPVIDVKEYRGKAKVEAFEYSAKDGSVINFISVPVIVDGNYHTERLFFSNRYKDEMAMRCEETYPVHRIVRTLQTLRALTPEEMVKERVAMLLAGITETEDAAGYFSSIPEDVVVEQVIFEGAKIRVRFNDALERGVGGSCRVTVIRSQIIQTVKSAIEGVEGVEIAIGERVEDVLPP